jgi:hypothetical protein
MITNDEKIKKLAQIALTNRLMVFEAVKILQNVYEQLAPLLPENPKHLDTIARFEQLEAGAQQIEEVETPKDRKFFGLD